MDTQQLNKAWYKHWWGAITALLILPLFALWYVWSELEKSKAFRLGATVILLALYVGGFMSLTYALSSPPHSSQSFNPVKNLQAANTAEGMHTSNNTPTKPTHTTQTTDNARPAVSKISVAQPQKTTQTTDNSPAPTTNNASTPPASQPGKSTSPELPGTIHYCYDGYCSDYSPICLSLYGSNNQYVECGYSVTNTVPTAGSLPISQCLPGSSQTETCPDTTPNDQMLPAPSGFCHDVGGNFPYNRDFTNNCNN